MRTFIAFLPVDNSLEIGCSDIEGATTEQIVKTLKQILDSDECIKIYDITSNAPRGIYPNIKNLVNDYNNEDLDLGWWAVNFTYESDTDLANALNGEFIEKTINETETNSNKYLSDTTNTENGTIYRKEDWQNADPDEIIYISEFELTELDKLIEEGKTPTDAELIEQGIASSKNSIRAEIKQYYPEATDEWIDKHDLIADIMQFASWEHTATVVDQMTEWDEIWDDYPEN